MNEIATTNDGMMLPSAAAHQNLAAQVQNMDLAYRLAEQLTSTQLVPTAYRGKPADAAAAILYGAELGLNALQSLQQVMVINGKPGVEARTMVAQLKARGYKFTTVESTPESVTVRAESPQGEVEESTWTMQRATTAGFTKNKLYQAQPEAMLYAKAATEVCRRLAPHVLGGMPYSAEELRMEFAPEPVQATATRTDKPAAADRLKALKAAPAPEDAPEPEPEPAAETLDADTPIKDERVEQFHESIRAAADRPTLKTLMTQADDLGLGDAIRDVARTRWAELEPK
ncbi:hypothetical protein C1Y63_10465 [Corynebacterium sp. 13CS0277]|uniref:hypothetical protein n=1 Tax=Corynebacterium sp. 13CS0277 TaxID=2071994 RepID=UPI000D02FC4B|nr:hypothetical protein [Corynebacterium sp. 13CS0277]PRQ10609.1 hypothetical protein C1Y63_10465 [Corynebacterium sp. 13CS0277]